MRVKNTLCVFFTQKTETYFASFFKGLRHEGSLVSLVSLTDETLNQTGFPDHEIKTLRNLALEKLHIQKSSKVYVALQLLE